MTLRASWKNKVSGESRRFFTGLPYTAISRFQVSISFRLCSAKHLLFSPIFSPITITIILLAKNTPFPFQFSFHSHSQGKKGEVGFAFAVF